MIRSERIETALRDRVWTIPSRPGDRHWNGLLLQSGEAIIEDRESRSWLDPSMAFLAPADFDRTMRILAGSEGILFAFDQKIASATVGHGVDGETLLQLLETRVLVRLDDGDVALHEVEFALGLLMNAAVGAGTGQETLVEAALKIVLVALLRNMPDSFSAAHKANRGSQLLQRFRHLMEAHFRERWTVARYATSLGVGPDRLHDLCTTKLGKTPSELIGDRSNFEAKILLRNSAVSVAEISNRLGFKDPSHFSRFFTRMNDEGPRAFRNRQNMGPGDGQAASIGFEDWP